MLDALPATRLDAAQQDTGHVSDFAPTPSGCRPDNTPQLKTVTETRGRRPGYHHKPRPPVAPITFRPAWYVVASQPKAERTAHASLHRAGFEPYLPLLTVRRPDRTYHTGPLWSGYLFVRLDLSKPWHPVRSCPGVFSLIAIDGNPTPCPDAVLDALRASEHLRATPTPPSALWAPGMACKLAAGPFAQHDAVVTEVSRETATIAIMMLGHLRQVTVPLDALTQRTE